MEQSGFDFPSSAETQPQSPIEFTRPEASLLLWEAFLPQAEADALFTTLLQHTPWQHEALRSYGKLRPLPRLTAWYGDPGARYHYSGIVNEPLPWTPLLHSLRDRIHTCTGQVFNSVLLNLYRSGADSLSWHQDNEPELGERPVIGRVPPACG
jgi:alkylated DNA repair dioxygenase AlkB